MTTKSPPGPAKAKAGKRNGPRVCMATEIPGNWAGDWLCTSKKHGTSAHRTRDEAYRMLYQAHPELRRA